MKTIFKFLVFLAIPFVLGIILFPKLFPFKPVVTEIEPKQQIESSDTSEEINENDIEEYITYDEAPADNTNTYFEKVAKVNGEYLYIAFPLKIQKDKPPRLIVYSHGSNTIVSKDFADQFMKDLQGYGKYFVKENYAFVASNMHGANWGSDQAVQDILNATNYIKDRYLVDEKIDLIGFSMGGLPTFNYMFKYPKTVNCTFLLAPTSREYSKENMKAIKNIPIKILHGDKDVNVPLYLSTSLLSRNNSFGYDNISLKIVNGVGHFDIDTEKKSTILKFFKTYE